MQFFNNVNPLLEKFIRHYWYVYAEENESFKQKLLLPMDHVDLIMTLGDSFIYARNEEKYEPESIHIHGIRESSVQITQPRKIQALGISFTPWGFYFLAKQPMNQFINKIVNLSVINHLLWNELFAHMMEFNNPSEFIKTIEQSLIKYIETNEREELDCKIIEDFLQCSTIKDYCEINGISIRRLERIFTKYIGTSPKKFMDIIKFEESARGVMNDKASRLTDLSYKYGYYDQPHFTKVFKGYTYYSPRDFQSKKPALKSDLHYE
ncbi:helix-turn-helix domain-containing protein [Vallitalea okinawensis]|uniref:helix-turn-helix domain-containing protein n=1 Tax=Vallitalea okinawensis TaxID=2078660 RepID=UPI000CFE2ED3|nr:helix-turn-helix domain-containing protein [Vallitalea okinawensis]